MKKDILFIGATHGNEPLGVEALKNIEKKYNSFDWIIGNPRAYEQNVRYTETDLNRAAPGYLNSPVFETRRAAEIIERAKQYRYAIDIHGTGNLTGIFLIVTKITKENLRLASMFNIQNIVLWPSVTPEMQYPPSEFFPCGLEIECGDKSNPETQKQLEEILQDFLKNYTQREQSSDEDILKLLQNKSVYQMYGDLKTSEGVSAEELKEFTEVTIQNKTFTPIFVSTYTKRYGDVLCYKLQTLNTKQIQNILEK